MIDCNGSAKPAAETGFTIMRIKIIAVLVIVVASAAFFVAARNDSRANAASGNCYSDAQGPTTPTICD